MFITFTAVFEPDSPTTRYDRCPEGPDSFLEGRAGENIEDVLPALQQALSSPSDDDALSRIRRCLDQVHGEIVDRVLVDLIHPARGYVGTTGCRVSPRMWQTAPPAGRLLVELSSSGDVQVGDTGDTVYQVVVQEFPPQLPCN